MNRFIQKPVIVEAEQVRQECVVETLEGPETAYAGDWIVVGVKGERWPVGDEVFKQKYEQVPNEPGKFRKRPVVVEAEQLQCDTTVETRRGPHAGKAGDWLVREIDSDGRYICKHDIFLLTYEPVPD